MDKTKCDFSGWLTKYNVLCSDGRTIMPDAFKHCDGMTIPLVWNHDHTNPENTLGKLLLEHRAEGVYSYGFFNDSESGKLGKLLVKHGDITALSVCANKLKQVASKVLGGKICEGSLVHAGANPDAFIDTILAHNEDGECERAIIYTGENIELAHSDSGEDEETVQDIIDSMNDKQRTVFYGLLGEALKSKEGDDDDDTDPNEKKFEGGNDTMKHNVFDKEDQQEKLDKNTLTHSEMQTILNDGKRYGTLKESFLAHAENYGIQQIDWLFPYGEGEGKNVTNTPIFIDRDQGWVSKIMNAVHHTPFSRIKSMFADITADEARAKGYIKGNLKKEEVFTLLKRTTSPTTVYKKQKLDRDDVVDITDFDVVAWIKSEMRGKLNEELARAYLIGDGRLADSEDKIKEDCIRPVWTDDDKLFTINAVVTSDGTDEGRAAAFIKACIKNRKGYKGSGNPTLYTTEDMLTEMLLLTDKNGRDLYEDEAKLCKKLRVKEIVTVPVMEGATREKDGKTRALLGIIVNMNDYNVGADKGGAVNMFDDFDIDYNAQKYLIETRCSGALILPFSAIVLEEETTVADAA